MARVFLLFGIDALVVFVSHRPLLHNRWRNFLYAFSLPEYGNQRKLPNEVGKHATEEPEPGIDGGYHGDHVTFDELVMNRMTSVVAIFDMLSPQKANESEAKQVETHD